MSDSTPRPAASPPSAEGYAEVMAPSRAANDTSAEVLARVPILLGVSEQALHCLAARARWRVLAAGEVALDAGDATDEVFFVTEGAVRVVLRSAAGHEVILNDLGSGDLFGELAAIDGIRRSASVTALLRTRLCAVPGPAFLEVALNSPTVALRLMRLLAARVRVKDERLLEATVLPVRQRLLAELLRLSRDRGNGERRLSPPPQQHVLAARLGLRRETVSREVAKLARAGLLTMTRRAIILHRPDALRAEIEVLLQEAT